MTGPPLVDRAVIDELCDSIGEDGARSVIELFVAESRLYLATIADSAAVEADPAARDRARRAAHSLKSGAGQIGAAAVAQAATAVEHAASVAAGVAEAAAALEHCAVETEAALAQFLSDK